MECSVILKIFNEGTVPERNVTVRLCQEKSCIRLVVVDSAGNPVENGTLFTLNQDGTGGLHDGVNPDLGLVLNPLGTLTWRTTT